VTEGHLPIASIVKLDSVYSCAVVDKISTVISCSMVLNNNNV